jgi:hypothetical protein
MADFNAWVMTILNPPTGTFVTLGKMKDKGDVIEVDFATSTVGTPVMAEATPV